MTNREAVRLSSGQVVYVVRSRVDPKVEHEWNMWHMDSHVPEVLKQPGFVRATRLRRADSPDDMPEYWTIYEMQSLRAFEQYKNSDAAGKLRAEHDEKFGEYIRIERFVLAKLSERSV